MRFITFLFLASMNCSCANKYYTSFIPKEYNYPDNKIGSGKSFIYENSQTGQKAYKDIKMMNRNGINYRTIKSYGSESVSDSAIISNGETMELYNFFMSGDGKITKGEKLQDTILPSREKLGTHLTKWTYRTTQLLYTTEFEEKFIKDTSINWQDRQLPCLMTQATGIIHLVAIKNASENYQTPVIFKFYFAKGIGIIKYSVVFRDHNGKDNNDTWNLTTIEEIQ